MSTEKKSYTIKNVEAFCEFIDSYLAENADSFTCSEAFEAYRNAQPKIPSEGEGVIVILNYGPKSHAVFGEDTRGVKEALMALNEPKKIVSFSSKLEFGSGWIIMDKAKLKTVLAVFDEHEIAHSEIEREDFVSGNEPEEKPVAKKPAKKVVAKKTLPSKKVVKKVTKKESEEEPDEEEEKPAKKVVKSKAKTTKSKTAKVVKKAPPAKEETTRLKAKKNAQGNYVEEDTGFVFVQAPVGTGGRQVSIAIGVQNADSEEMGLASVNPLDSEMIEECTNRELQYLTTEMMKLIAKRNPELHEELKEMQSRGGDEENGGDDGDDGNDVEEDE